MAYRGFMDALMQRRLRPGRLVSQRQIAAITGASLPSVREALKRLEAESIVELIPKRGVMIREVSRADIRDAYGLRALIELAAVGPFTRAADPALLSNLREKTRAVIEAQPDTPETQVAHFARRVELDNPLHRTIVAALGNKLASETHARIEMTMLLARLALPVQFHTTGPAFDEHLRLLDAVSAGDETAARAALAEHLDRACARSVAAAED